MKYNINYVGTTTKYKNCVSFMHILTKYLYTRRIQNKDCR